MTTLQDVIEAWRAISEAEERYRETVRAAVANGVRQVDIAKSVGRTREMIRRDAMPEDRREAMRQADLDRHRRRREEAKRTN